MERLQDRLNPLARLRRGVWIAGSLALLWAGGAAVALAAPATIDYQRLLAETAPKLVTVKFVLQVKFGGTMSSVMGGDQEMDSEVTCLMIDPEGLVLCSNIQFNGYVELMKRMMPQGMDVSASPKDLKVLVARETEAGEMDEAADSGGSSLEEMAASVVVRDSDRDLVWLRIDEPGERKFPFFDFATASEPAVGEPIIGVYRLDRFFERAAILAEARVGGIIERPRKLFVPAASFSAGLGAPVLDAAGVAVGFTVFQYPEQGELGGSDNPLAIMSQSSRMQQGIQGLILPAAEIVKATAQVRAMAEEDEEE